MATSGRVVSGTLKNSFFYVDWQQTSQSIANNKTYINWQVGLSCNGNYWYSNAVRIDYVRINGEQVKGTQTYSNFLGGTYQLDSGTAEISHNADGTKSFSIEISGWLYSYGTTTGSGTFELTTIPRKSSITATDANIESATTININRASSSFTHTITYSFSDLTGTLKTKTNETSFGWTIPASFYAKIPNSKTGTVTLTCTTYSGDTSLGSTTTTFTISVPTSGTNDSRPVIDTAEVEDIYLSTTSLTGNSKRLIRYLSWVELSLTGRCLNSAGFNSLKEGTNYDLTSAVTTSTSSGTTTTSISNLVLFSNISGKPLTQDIIEFTIKDSRGLESKKVLSEENGDFTLVPYILPTLDAKIQRVSPTSNSIKLSFSGNFYNGYFDENNIYNNYLNIYWRFKEKGGSWNTTGDDVPSTGWRDLTEGTDYEYIQNENQYQSIGNITITDFFDYKKEYVIEVRTIDRASSKVTLTFTLSKGIPYYDYGVDSNGNNYFNINGYLYGMSAITGQEIPTNEYIDGEQVFRKRINTGTLPNNDMKTVSSGLTSSNINIIRMLGAAKATNGTQIPLPFSSIISNYNVEISLSSTGYVQISTSVDRSSYTQSYVDLYYTKITT